MNKTYTISIDVAALSQDAAFRAVEKVLYSRTRASDEAAIMRAVPGFECFVGIRQEGQRVENPEPCLPTNLRVISVKEAVEMYECYNEGGFVEVEGSLAQLCYYYSRPIVGSKLRVVFSAWNTYLCMTAEEADEANGLICEKYACRLVQSHSGDKGAGSCAASEGSGCKNEVAEFPLHGDGKNAAGVDDAADAVIVGNSDELGHAASVAENHG